jgi:hypothetical protein
MRETPASARSYALDSKTRAALLQLDPANAAWVEQDTPLTGELGLAIADDFEHKIATNHYFLHTPTGDRGIAFADGSDHTGLVHHQITVTGLSLPEVVAVETIREASHAEIDQCLAPLAQANLARANTVSASAWSSPVRSNVTVPTGAATPVCSTFGNQTMAIILLNFAGGTSTLPAGVNQPSFWQNLFTGPTPSVNDFINETSYGQIGITADAYGPITLPGSYDCTTTDGMATAAIAAAQGTVDFSSYNRIVLVYPVAACGFAGLGAYPTNATTTINHQYTVMWLPVLPTYTTTNPANLWSDLSHEFGHNLTLNHSNTLDFGSQMLGPLDFAATNPGTVHASLPAPDSAWSASSPSVYAPATATPAPDPEAAAAAPSGSTSVTAINTEYGDSFAMMGYTWNPAGGYSAMHRFKELGWLNAVSEQDVTASGNFNLAPIEATSGLRALHVLRDPTSNSWIWIEFQQPLGIYEPLSQAGFATLGQTNDYTSGAVLRYENGFGAADYTFLLDNTATAQPNNFLMSNLVPGSTWSDPYSLLTITTGAQTASSLPITISYDAPCATVALSSATLATAGGTAAVNITAPATCNWSVASNASWISFPGATTGTGNATVTFNYAANTTGAERQSYLTAQRQSLPVTQTSGGLTVLPLSTPAINVMPGNEIPITFSISDENGIADLLQVNVDIVGNAGVQSCMLGLENNTGNTSSLYAYLLNNLVGGPLVMTGTGTPQTISACTFDPLNSSLSVNGNIATITLAMSFPASFYGIHGIQVSAQNAAGQTPTLPIGFVNVSTNAVEKPTVIMNPASGTQGATVPVTFIGGGTKFTAGSTVTVSGTGVTASNVTFTSATSLGATLNIASTAAPGAYTVTITSGAEVDATTFTVNAAIVPTATITPASGNQGSTVAFSITTNLPFTGSTNISVSGNGVTVPGFNFLSNTTLAGNFVIAANADLGPHTVSLTSAALNVSGVFTVNPAANPSIVLNPNTGTTGSSFPVTITGTNTNFTAASTISASDPTITFSNVTFVNATSLSATMNIAPNSIAAMDTITVISGAEVDTTTFTVSAALMPTFTTTPGAGGTGANSLPITINGVNTAFSVASAVAISGSGVTIGNVNTAGTGLMFGNLTISPTAKPGPYMITITTGKQTVSHPFMVIASTQTASTLNVSSANLLPTQSLTLSAQVTPASGTAQPSGLVSFVEVPASAGPRTLASTPLSAGTASYTIAKPTLGSHTYYVSYLGDNLNFDASSSSNLSVTVAQATPAVTLSGVPSGVLYPAAASGLSFSATLSGSVGVAPTGSVIFKDGATLLGTVTASNGAATLNGVNLAVGTHSITAAYSGDANFTAFTTPVQPVAVEDFTVLAGANSITASGTTSVSTTMTIAPGAGGFTQAIALSCSGAPANATCTIAPTSVTPGGTSTTASLTIATLARPSLTRSTGSMALLIFAAGSGWLLRRRRFAFRLLCWLLVLAGAAGTLTGCSSSSAPPGTPAGSYTLTVTGTAAGTSTLTHTATVTLLVE